MPKAQTVLTASQRGLLPELEQANYGVNQTAVAPETTVSPADILASYPVYQRDVAANNSVASSGEFPITSSSGDLPFDRPAGQFAETSPAANENSTQPLVDDKSALSDALARLQGKNVPEKTPDQLRREASLRKSIDPLRNQQLLAEQREKEALVPYEQTLREITQMMAKNPAAVEIQDERAQIKDELYLNYKKTQPISELIKDSVTGALHALYKRFQDFMDSAMLNPGNGGDWVKATSKRRQNPFGDKKGPKTAQHVQNMVYKGQEGHQFSSGQ